ncbi:FecCD family ABC transporter permease [Paenibacillus sp. y28]|uniref:FecCD family ABC transporter permease n=1 Tax=Paenibacillus sp. y28 TaxID=3129110 RepID=UPI003016BE83
MVILLRNGLQKWSGLAGAFVLMLLCMAASVLFGIKQIPFHTIIEAYTSFNGSNEHLIITTTRVPRAFIAAAVGASLAMAGALMQALTRNPLASPTLFGINSGAAFALVLVSALSSLTSLAQITWVSFIGAGAASIIVYALGSAGRDGLTPIKITLAGAALTAFFSSMTSGVLLVNGKTFDQVLSWLVGSVANRDLSTLLAVLPYLIAAWIGALIIAGPVNLMAMGDDVAKGLGQRTLLVKIVLSVIVVILAGGAVAIAGPIGFVGIMIPHLARALVGNDHRWLLPFCGLLGAVLLLGADVGSRFLMYGKEVPVGAVTAIIGVPFFVVIARRKNNE